MLSLKSKKSNDFIINSLKRYRIIEYCTDAQEDAKEDQEPLLPGVGGHAVENQIAGRDHDRVAGRRFRQVRDLQLAIGDCIG